MSESEKRTDNAAGNETSQLSLGARIRTKSQNKIEKNSGWPTPPLKPVFPLKYPLASPPSESSRMRAWEGDGDDKPGDGVESSVTQSVGAESRMDIDVDGGKDVPDDVSMITVPESKETLALRARRKREDDDRMDEETAQASVQEWKEYYEEAVKLEQEVQENQAKKAAESVIQKQMAMARVISQSDGKKAEWNEWGRKAIEEAEKDHHRAIESAERHHCENICRLKKATEEGITQVEAHKANLMVGIQAAEEIEQRDNQANAERELRRIQGEKSLALSMMQMGGVRGVKRPNDTVRMERKKLSEVNINASTVQDLLKECDAGNADAIGDQGRGITDEGKVVAALTQVECVPSKVRQSDLWDGNNATIRCNESGNAVRGRDATESNAGDSRKRISSAERWKERERRDEECERKYREAQRKKDEESAKPKKSPPLLTAAAKAYMNQAPRESKSGNLTLKDGPTGDTKGSRPPGMDGADNPCRTQAAAMAESKNEEERKKREAKNAAEAASSTENQPRIQTTDHPLFATAAAAAIPKNAAPAAAAAAVNQKVNAGSAKTRPVSTTPHHRRLNESNRSQLEPIDRCWSYVDRSGNCYDMTSWVYVLKERERRKGRNQSVCQKDGVSFFMLSSYENLLKMNDSGDDEVRGVKEDHRDRITLTPRESLPLSAVCLYVTGIMDYTTGTTIKEWFDECGVVLAIHPRREPDDPSMNQGRPQGSMYIQMREARMATRAIELLHGRIMPRGEGGERMKNFTLSVQRSDREFDLSRMTGRNEFQDARGTRVSSGGDQSIIWPNSIWIYGAYLSNGYDKDKLRGHPTDIIRFMYPETMQCPITKEEMPEWLYRSGQIWGTVSEFGRGGNR